MISLKAVENLLGFSYPTIPAISAIDIFVVTKSWVWFAKLRLCRRCSSEGDTVASIGSVATLPKKHLSVLCLLG